MKDKRIECGCHKGCITLKHFCFKKCEWPACLTDEENRQLIKEIEEILFK